MLQPQFLLFPRSRLAAYLLAISVLLTACTPQPAERELAFDTRIYLNQRALQVAVFETPQAHRFGLMGIQQLPENTGGLFVFEAATPVHFWMKNVLIELDILFFDQQGELLSRVESAQPCGEFHCPIFSVTDVKYVLEVRGGFVRENAPTKPLRLRVPE